MSPEAFIPQDFTFSASRRKNQPGPVGPAALALGLQQPLMGWITGIAHSGGRTRRGRDAEIISNEAALPSSGFIFLLC